MSQSSRKRWGYLALVLCLALAVGALVSPVPAAGYAQHDLSLLELCLDFIANYYPGQWDIGRLLESAAKGLVQGLGDPYSEYLTASEYESLMTGLSGGFGGLGIYIDEALDGYIVIVAPIKGTPADLAGLRAGDKIAEVDGEDFRHVPLHEASARLRGEPGTKVILGILRQGVQGLVYFEITRAWIEINPVEYELLDDGIGYVYISSFTENAADRLDEALAALRAGGARAIVLDLRNNGGGLLDQGIAVAERFLRGGQTILSITRKQGPPDVYVASGVRYLDLPVAVVVNDGTASAAEIVAGAIKDNNMGTLVGTQTYGKGSIQNIWYFTTGGGLKLTTARFATASGALIEGQGIIPHEIVEQPWDAIFPPYLEWYRPIRHMRVGLDVLSLEEVLAFLDLPVGPPDGVYGIASVKAVEAFQESQGLPRTGIVDEQTAVALNRAVLDKQWEDDPQLDRALELLAAKIY